MRSVHTRVRKARTLTITVPLSSAGLAALRSQRPLQVLVRLAFAPSRGGGEKLSAVASAAFR